LILYHSREALTARLAALMHTGRLGQRPDPTLAWEAIAAPQAYRAEGLWPAGADRWGQAVYAVGRASRPDVVDRVFHGLAEVFGIDPGAYLLVDVGPVQAWGDLALIGLRRLGLSRLARRLELRLLERRWPACHAAVERARFRIGERMIGRRGPEPFPPELPHPSLLPDGPAGGIHP
jgi:hypothetical protein